MTIRVWIARSDAPTWSRRADVRGARMRAVADIEPGPLAARSDGRRTHAVIWRKHISEKRIVLWDRRFVCSTSVDVEGVAGRNRRREFDNTAVAARRQGLLAGGFEREAVVIADHGS